MKTFRKRTRPAGLRQEGSIGRWLRLRAAGKLIKGAGTAEPSSDSAEPRFTWLDVSTIKRVEQAIAGIRAWAYTEIGKTQSDAYQLLAKLDSAVRHRELMRTACFRAVQEHASFKKRVESEGALAELHRAAGLWTRGGFACCVIFASLTLQSPLQALGIGIELGPTHADLARYIGNGLAWLAAFVFGWITTSVGKTVGSSIVNRSAKGLVKDARVAGRYFWLIPTGGVLLLVAALFAAAIVRDGHLKLIALESPIPAWSFAVFAAAIEGGAILLGWAAATPIADAERRLAAALSAAATKEKDAGEAVDVLVGDIASLMSEQTAIKQITEELERGQLANAAEEIAVRAAANPAWYGMFDQLNIARGAFPENPAQALTVDTILAGESPDDGSRDSSGYDALRKHVEEIAKRTWSNATHDPNTCAWRSSLNGSGRRSSAPK